MSPNGVFCSDALKLCSVRGQLPTSDQVAQSHRSNEIRHLFSHWRFHHCVQTSLAALLYLHCARTCIPWGVTQCFYATAEKLWTSKLPSRGDREISHCRSVNRRHRTAADGEWVYYSVSHSNTSSNYAKDLSEKCANKSYWPLGQAKSYPSLIPGMLFVGVASDTVILIYHDSVVTVQMWYINDCATVAHCRCIPWCITARLWYVTTLKLAAQTRGAPQKYHNLFAGKIALKMPEFYWIFWCKI